MKRLACLIIFFCSSQLATGQLSGFHYVSPRPHSILNSRGTNIIIRQGHTIDRSSVDDSRLTVRGSGSGIHTGRVFLSDDNKTLVFASFNAYAPGETVAVGLSAGIKTVDSKDVGSLEFSFTISPVREGANLPVVPQAEPASSLGATSLHMSNSVAHTDSVPADWPKITVGTINNPAEGNIFLTNQSQTANKAIGSYLMILNNDGSPFNYKKIPTAANGFKMEVNGDLSFNFKSSGARIILDTSLTPIDTLQGGNGYRTDGHDFLLLPNGHAFVIASDPEPVDMSLVVPGGNPDATVTGLVVQEIDASQNVVFQWRSWDYLPITGSYFDLTQQAIDLIHANALAVAGDGNILVSLRHYSSVVKIDRETGDVVWILGGKGNQFTFINEHASNAPTYFSYQHDIDVLPNGHLTLFDNGTQHSPEYSRGVEYSLDEQNKTATMVWDYRHSPDIYADAMGSVERLPNGNTLVGWGQATGAGIPALTEVHPDNSTALEFFLPAGQFCYRAYKYLWVSQNPEASVPALEVLQGNTYTFNTAGDSTGIAMTFKQITGYTYASAGVTSYRYAPVNPAFAGTPPIVAPLYFIIQGLDITSYNAQVGVDLHLFPGISLPRQTVVYVRPLPTDPFSPLPTSYDSSKNELVFTTAEFGDFAFGVPQSVAAYSPVPISPKNNDIVNGGAAVKLLWGTRGIVQSYRIQVATDSTFASPVVDFAGLTTTSRTLASVNNNARYFWRVNNVNSAGTSDWSGVSEFSTASPFIKITSPNGGEHVVIDSTYVIRWQSNVQDTVDVDLMRGNTVVSVIADSILSGTSAILWQIPSTVTGDSSYKIRIHSVTHPGVADTSDNSFTIGAAVTGISSPQNTVTTYALYQNYPNPFNPATVISYQVPKSSPVALIVFDILGREVRTLVNQEQPAGRYTITFDASNLASGVYFYRMQAAGFVQTRRLLLLR